MAERRPDDVVVALRGITKEFALHEEPGWRSLLPGREGEPSTQDALVALEDVSLTIRRGEALGLVGRNGAGKSTLLRVIAGTVLPTSGQVDVRGALAPALTLGVGFDEEFTGAENLYFAGSLLGLSRSEVRERFDDMVDFAGIREFIHMPVRRYSSGMKARLGVALVMSVDASIVIIDEALAVGDWSFRQKSLRRLREMHERGTTLIMVSHDHWTLAQLCDRLILLEKGRLTAEGSVANVLHAYLGDEFVDDLPDRPTEPLAVLDRPSAPTGCTIVDLELRPTEIDPGDGLRYRAVLRVDTPMDAHVTVSLSSYGRVAFLEDEPGPTTRFDVAGEWSVEGAFEAVPLAPGEYQVRVAVHAGGLDEEPFDELADRPPPLDWRTETFTVRGEISPMPGLMLDADFTIAHTS